MSIRTRSSSNGRTATRTTGAVSKATGSSSRTGLPPKAGAAPAADPMLCDTYVEDDGNKFSSKDLDDFEDKLTRGVQRPAMGAAAGRLPCKPKPTNMAPSGKGGLQKKTPAALGSAFNKHKTNGSKPKPLSEEEVERLQDMADVAALP